MRPTLRSILVVGSPSSQLCEVFGTHREEPQALWKGEVQNWIAAFHEELEYKFHASRNSGTGYTVQNAQDHDDDDLEPSSFQSSPSASVQPHQRGLMLVQRPWRWLWFNHLLQASVGMFLLGIFHFWKTRRLPPSPQLPPLPTSLRRGK